MFPCSCLNDPRDHYVDSSIPYSGRKSLVISFATTIIFGIIAILVAVILPFLPKGILPQPLITAAFVTAILSIPVFFVPPIMAFWLMGMYYCFSNICTKSSYSKITNGQYEDFRQGNADNFGYAEDVICYSTPLIYSGPRALQTIFRCYGIQKRICNRDTLDAFSSINAFRAFKLPDPLLIQYERSKNSESTEHISSLELSVTHMHQFNNLKNKLVEHFEQETPIPVMVSYDASSRQASNSSKSTILILGIKTHGEKTTLWVWKCGSGISDNSFKSIDFDESGTPTDDGHIGLLGDRMEDGIVGFLFPQR